MCLAQGHNAVTPLQLKPTAPQSQVKHSTTEPLRSLGQDCMRGIWKVLSMVFYLRNQLTKPIMFGIILKRYLSILL